MNHRLLAVAVTAAALLAAGCGSDAEKSTATPPAVTGAPSTAAAASTTVAPVATEAVTSTAPAGAVKKAIVSLSPSATEMLFAIGAGSQVIAVDDQSNYPAEALQKPHDLSGYQPNVEAIAKLKPDLVVIGGDFTGLTDQLKSVHIDVWNGPAATGFDDVDTQIEQLGALTGHVGEAAQLVSKIHTGIDAAVRSAPKLDRPLSYYHELDPTFFSVTSNAFIGHVYSLFGLRNIADISEGDNDYPQLSAEAIVAANPDLIFLADTKCCQQNAATVGARDGWSQIAAVKNGNVFVMDDDVASRWGPRIVDYVQAVADALSTATVPVG